MFLKRRVSGSLAATMLSVGIAIGVPVSANDVPSSADFSDLVLPGSAKYVQLKVDLARQSFSSLAVVFVKVTQTNVGPVLLYWRHDVGLCRDVSFVIRDAKGSLVKPASQVDCQLLPFTYQKPFRPGESIDMHDTRLSADDGSAIGFEALRHWGYTQNVPIGTYSLNAEARRPYMGIDSSGHRVYRTRSDASPASPTITFTIR